MADCMAIILAAGVGVRLRPLTTRVPKALLRVGPRPIIDYIIEALAKSKITNVCVVVGHNASAIMRHLSENFPYSQFNISYIYNPYYSKTNTAYSLWLTSELFLEHDVIVVNGDLLVVPEAVERMMNGRRTCLGIQRHSCGEEEVKVRLRGNRVTYLGKQLCPDEANGEYVGIAKITRRFGGRFQNYLEAAIKARGGETLYYDDVIHQLLTSYRVEGTDLTDLRMIEIDTPKDLARARKAYPHHESSN